MSTIYYFIRHCEKEFDGTYNPPLTPQGYKRAKYWAKIFSEKAIDLVFCTPLIRTQETAEPLLEKLRKDFLLYDPTDLYNQSFQRLTKDKTSLIIGHQDTTPTFINRILKERRFDYIPGKEFGNLYTVIIENEDNITAKHQYYHFDITT